MHAAHVSSTCHTPANHTTHTGNTTQHKRPEHCNTHTQQQQQLQQQPQSQEQHHTQNIMYVRHNGIWSNHTHIKTAITHTAIQLMHRHTIDCQMATATNCVTLAMEQCDATIKNAAGPAPSFPNTCTVIWIHEPQPNKTHLAILMAIGPHHLHQPPHLIEFLAYVIAGQSGSGHMNMSELFGANNGLPRNNVEWAHCVCSYICMAH